MKFIWTKQLSVGNRAIDSKHKKLHDILNEIARLIAASDVAAMLAAFEMLEHCLHACFAVEESVAQAIGFDLSLHRQAHQRLLNQFQCIKDELANKNGMWSRDEGKYYADTLMSYLIKHIKVDDKPFKAVLDTHFYDLKPHHSQHNGAPS
jgi:hemerythrin-like metal-binding protein